MGLLKNLKIFSVKAWRKLSTARYRLTSRPASPLADRLLTDALLFAQLPSPTEREEQRTKFILERVRAMGYNVIVGERDEIEVSVKADDPVSSQPLLLFANVGSSRWHPLASLTRVDTSTARGAGLADALGVAGLLSLLEAVKDGAIKPAADLKLLFSVGPLDEPDGSSFRRYLDNPSYKPFAALGLRGLELGSVIQRSLGTYRLSARIKTTPLAKAAETVSPSAVEVAVAVAQRLGGVCWDADGATSCRIQRIQAGLGFGHDPTEGLIDIELVSAKPEVLEVAKTAAIATAETAGRETGASIELRTVGHVPVGDPAVNQALIQVLRELMRDNKLKIREEIAADPASFLSSARIPASYLALASGREGLETDEIEITSIDAGRNLLFSFVANDRALRGLALNEAIKEAR